MTDESYDRDEFMQLLGAVRDENISAEQVENLEAIMAGESSARRTYIQFMSIHGLLEQDAVNIAIEDTIAAKRAQRPSLARFWPLLVAAAVLVIAFPTWWFLNKAGAPPIVAHRTDSEEPNVVTFLIEGPASSDAGPEAGNFDPVRFSYLVPLPDIIVYGKVESVRNEKVKFRIREMLRGEAEKIKVDTSKREEVGCVPSVINWPVGQECCLFLELDPETKLYRPVYYGAGVQQMPYQGIVDIDALREIIRVWDLEYQKLPFDQAEEKFKTAGEREKLVFSIVRGNYYDAEFKANVAKLNELLRKDIRDQ
ncbi:MAG: hypothetical protein ACI9G1_003683 [Pirellulaceae bacterium]|jgi:hypothetical protein